MRIVILGDALDNQRAGIHVYTQEMVRAIIEQNQQHDIIIIREKEDSNLVGAQQIAVKNTRLPIGYASLRLFVIIPAIIRRLKADVVIEPAHFGPFNLPASIKRVTIIHDLTPILFPDLHRPIGQWLQRIFLKRILKKADLIITNSDHTQKDLNRVYPFTRQKSMRIYPGFSHALVSANQVSIAEIPKVEKPYFLTVGTIEPRKNHLLTLKAFESFKNNLVDAPFKWVVVGGKGWKSSAFFDALSKSKYRNDIILTGHVNNAALKSLYVNAIALIYPSKYEGFGFPVLESLCLNAPVITAANSSLTEVGGQYAHYIHNEDPTSLAHLMVEVYHQHETLDQESLSHHLKQFSWSTFSRVLIQKLEDIID